jgi:hypothetical protein
MLCDNLQTCVR